MNKRSAEKTGVLIDAILTVYRFADIRRGGGTRRWEMRNMCFPGWVEWRRMGQDEGVKVRIRVRRHWGFFL